MFKRVFIPLIGMLTMLFVMGAALAPSAPSLDEINISMSRVRNLFEEGTAGQVLTARGGSGDAYWTSVNAFGVTGITDKAILYGSATDTLEEDPTNFSWDNAANASFLQLGAGTGPGAIKFLEGSGTGTNKITLTIATSSADGTVTLPASGTLATLAGTEVLAGKTLTTPVIGVATGTSLAVTGLLTTSSPSANFGFATGAGGAVTQITNKATGVTMVPDPCSCGAITMNNASLAGDAEVSFTVTDSGVAATDTIIVSVKSGASTGKYLAFVSAVGAGTFEITVSNVGATASEVVVINFAILSSPVA